MGYVEQTDVRKLMQDPKLIAEVAKAIGEDPETLDSLADDIADKLSDELENHPELRKKIVERAIANPDFKKRVVRKLVEELSD